MEEDLIAVANLRVLVSIPTGIEEDGERVEFSPAELEKRAADLAKELEELNFPELLKALGQKIAEEQFLKFRPIVDVSVAD